MTNNDGISSAAIMNTEKADNVNVLQNCITVFPHLNWMTIETNVILINLIPIIFSAILESINVSIYFIIEIEIFHMCASI